MELCLGGELYLHLRRQSKFDENAIKFYAAEIILAMQYLHEKLHLIHRYLFIISLKLSYLSTETSNLKMSSSPLMVTSNLPISVSLKVHSKAIFIFSQPLVTIKANSVCGTPEYLAPEIVLRQSYGKVVDWWSVGCLLFEMYTGYPPFSSRDREELNDDIILVKKPDYRNY